MVNTILCPHCQKEVEITEALRHQIKEQVTSDIESRYKKQLEEAKEKALMEAKKRVSEETQFILKDKENETREMKAQLEKLQSHLLTVNKKNRELEAKRIEEELAMQKKLIEETEKLHREKLTEMVKLKEDVQKQVMDEYRMKDLEKDKKLQDALRMNDELRRKLEQGSQQTQGEVLELELEDILRKAFPSDMFTEVKKGVRGADIMQMVIDKQGKQCGLILWESKNAQWSDAWIKKLREDQREAKAQLAVLVLAKPTDGITTYTYRDGIWITNRNLASSLALALRYDLVRVQFERLAHIGKNEKMEVLYQYIRSTEFIHRIDAFMDYFKNVQNDIEKEKRYFQTKWARQEKELRNVLDNTYGMYGELQALTGRELPDVKLLDAPEEEITV